MSKFHTLTIKEIKKETPNAVSILFDIPTEFQNEFQFKAGQYLNIKKTIAGKELRRAYSICTAPNSNNLAVVVKAVDNGTFSVFANTILKKGDTLEVEKPEGKFVLETAKNNSKNYLAIAAGSGITPIMAMLKATLTEEPNSTFTLIYGNKTVTETIFKDEIDALQKNFPNNLNVQYVYSQEEQENALFGRIDKANINYVVKNKCKHLTFDKAFLCGPEAMIHVAIDVLVENNINKDNIFFELFSTPISSEEKATQNFEGTSEITVIVDDEETTFNMDAKTTILNAALKEGLDAPYSCQGGICSSCLAKVTAGTAKMEKNAILSDSEIEEGLILTCQAHPTSQKITIDYDDV